MNEKFFDLKKEKQDRMINAALKVFAINGYQKASTDDIVKEAGISKGLLFHYFGSKAGTYTFMYEYSSRFMMMELERAVSLREKDLFRLLEQMEEAKSVLLSNYPYMQKFLLTHMSLTDENIKEAIAPYVDKVPQIMGEIMERADYSRIKDGVDTDLLVRTMYYVTRGLMEMALVTGMGPDVVLKEAVAYYEMMRSQFTKEDYL
ncbi:MAG: TetR/AcrR family transcriptional regulator [Lachnospiraceae bacterium]|nr:TetR/AcrR family transcriptional regulator [Lachnospiraceae bacterium]